METIEGRGISNDNNVFFIFDAEKDVVVMATYRDVPGVRSDLLKPNIIKTFTKDEWGEINEFLMAGAREEEEKEGLKKLEEMKIDEAFAPKVMDLPKQDEVSVFHNERIDTSVPITASIAAKDITLPKMNNVPSMTSADAPEGDSILMDVEEENGKTDE